MTILNPTLSEFNEIWHTCWFQTPNLKSKIFQWSDHRFPRNGRLIFFKFWENKGGHPTSKHHIFWTSGPIWKSKVSLTRGKKPGILIWHHFCDLGKFWGDDLLTYILTLRLTIEFTCHDHSLGTLAVMFNRSHVNVGRASTPRSLFYCLLAPHMYGVVLHAYPVCGESHNQCNTTPEVATTSLPFYNEPYRSHVLCVKAELRTTFTSWSQHHFVAIGNPEQRMRKASHCGSKHQYSSHAMITLLLLVRATYMYGIVLQTHPVRGESHNQRNTTGEVATLPTPYVNMRCVF